MSLDCDVENQTCTTSTLVYISTSTVTSPSSIYVTYYETSAITSTIIETATNTNLETVTNVATATELETTTLSVQAANMVRRLLMDGMASPRPVASHITVSTDSVIPITISDKQTRHEQSPITVFGHASHRLGRHQAETTTLIIYETVYETTTLTLTSVVVETDYTTSSTTEEVTSTSALGAQTTIHVTSTLIITMSAATVPGSSSSSSSAADGIGSTQDSGNSGSDGIDSTQDSGNSGSGGGLGRGSVAGIAIGAAGGALVLAGIVAFCVYRQRKGRKSDAPMGVPPLQRDSSVILPSSDGSHHDKLAPAAAYDPSSRPVSYQHQYYAIPNSNEESLHHEADGRMIGMRSMYSKQHVPVELTGQHDRS